MKVEKLNNRLNKHYESLEFPTVATPVSMGLLQCFSSKQSVKFKKRAAKEILKTLSSLQEIKNRGNIGEKIPCKKPNKTTN